MMEIKRAVRQAIPQIISLAGVSGSGKTYSALKLAAGLAGPGGKVALIDTENGRGAMYADSPGILKDLPGGFMRIPFDPPFSPARYIEALTLAEQNGITVCCIDSGSHGWEGIGGCCEIAETHKLRGMPNWSLAKREHKKFLNHLLSTSMHVIVCLRAREKVKILEVNGKTEVIPVGIQPIAEKNFVFEMLVSLLLEEQTHYAIPVKVPEPLASLFPAKHLITCEDGQRIREWNNQAPQAEEGERLLVRARAEAERGMEFYRAFYTALSSAQKKILTPQHEQNKCIAQAADSPQQREPGDDGPPEKTDAELDAEIIRQDQEREKR